MAGAVCLLGKLGRGCGGGTPGLSCVPSKCLPAPLSKPKAWGLQTAVNINFGCYIDLLTLPSP